MAIPEYEATLSQASLSSSNLATPRFADEGDNFNFALIAHIKGQTKDNLLDLSSRKLSKIPFGLINVHYGTVTSLDVSRNRIQYLPEDFALRLPHLMHLSLSHNYIRKLPDDFGNLDTLIYLDISFNELKTLPLSMGMMSQLQYINTSENRLEAPVATFPSIEDTRDYHGKYPLMIVQFLSKLEEEAKYFFGCSEGELPGQTGGPTFIESGSEQRKSEIFKYLHEVKRSSSNLDNMQEMSRSNHYNGQRLIKGALFFAAWLATVPLLIALMVDAGHIDANLDSSSIFWPLWNAYKPIHIFAENGLQSFQKSFLPHSLGHLLLHVKAPEKLEPEPQTWIGYVMKSLGFL